MNFVKGKRAVLNESIFGFLHVKDAKARSQTLYLVVGRRAFGVRWTLTPKK